PDEAGRLGPAAAGREVARVVAVYLLAAVLLLLLNAFFVLAEFAAVKMRPTRVQELEEGGDPRARIVRTIQTNLDEFLSVCQVGISFRLQGEDLDALIGATARLTNEIATAPGVGAIAFEGASTAPSLEVVPDRAKLAGTGIALEDLSLAVEAATSGRV